MDFKKCRYWKNNTCIFKTRQKFVINTKKNHWLHRLVMIIYNHWLHRFNLIIYNHRFHWFIMIKMIGDGVAIAYHKNHLKSEKSVIQALIIKIISNQCNIIYNHWLHRFILIIYNHRFHWFILIKMISGGVAIEYH